jgi:molecular chaperone HscB
MDHFERLGVPRRFSLDVAEMNRRYVAQSRALHPDFHGSASESEQSASGAMTASLNEAYRTLQDGFSRAEYLLQLLGGPTAAQDKRQDSLFLMEMMELREQLDEIRSTGGDASELSRTIACRYTDVLADAGRKLDALPTDANELSSIRQLLNVAKTLKSVLREIDGERREL